MFKDTHIQYKNNVYCYYNLYRLDLRVLAQRILFNLILFDKFTIEALTLRIKVVHFSKNFLLILHLQNTH